MLLKFVPLGLVASIFVSTVSARSLYSEQSTNLVARCGNDCGDGGSGEWSGVSGGNHDGGNHDGEHNGGEHGASLVDLSGNNVDVSNIVTDIGNDLTITQVLDLLKVFVASEDVSGVRGGHDGEGHDGEGHDGEGHDGEGHDGEGHDDEGHEDWYGCDECGHTTKRNLVAVNNNDVSVTHVVEDDLNDITVDDILNHLTANVATKRSLAKVSNNNVSIRYLLSNILNHPKIKNILNGANIKALNRRGDTVSVDNNYVELCSILTNILNDPRFTDILNDADVHALDRRSLVKVADNTVVVKHAVENVGNGARVEDVANRPHVHALKRTLVDVSNNEITLKYILTNLLNCLRVEDIANDADVDAL